MERKSEIGYVAQVLSIRDIPIPVREFLSFKNEPESEIKAALASVGFLVVSPDTAAKIISTNLFRYFTLSDIFGLISAVIGILIANYFNIFPGPLVVFAGISIFVVAIKIRWL